MSKCSIWVNVLCTGDALTLWKIFSVVRLLFSPLQRCSCGSCTSNRLLFSLTLSDTWDPRCAPLSARHALSQTVASLIYMSTWRTRLNLKPGPVCSNHVNRSNILLPKLTSFHLVASFTRHRLNEKGDCERHVASSFDVLTLSSLLTSLILF